MDPDSTLYATLLGLASLALGFFAVAAASLERLSRARYQHLLEAGTGRYLAIADFVERPGRYLPGLEAGRDLAQLGVAAAAAALLLHLRSAGVVQVVAAVVVVAAALLLGNSLPRALAAGQAEESALALAAPIRAAALLLWPVGWAVAGAGRVLGRLIGRPHPGAELANSVEELSDIIGERLVEEDEREMIDGIFDLEETTAREIMVPRMDVQALRADTSLAAAIDVVVKEGYSRLPVYEESIDDVVGILYAKDLLPLVRSGQLAGPARDLARPAYFIPESKKIGELLRELQQRKVHIAIVVDEYGGTAGLVTIEDLLEEIVGEIRDEFDAEEEKIVAGREGEAVFDATVSIGDVNDTLDLSLAGEEVDTIGGLVYERLGKVPLVGDAVSADGATITVVSTAGRRIRRVRVARVVAAANGHAAEG